MLCGWQYLTEEQRARIAEGLATNRVLNGPFQLEIHPTNQCSVNCFFCYCTPCRRGENFPWPALERLLREEAARDLRFLRISGGGESLIYPQINELLDLCGELGLRIVDLTTNATRLAPVAGRLVEVGVDFAMISINESDPARYGQMMRVKPAMFGKALEGIEALCRARDAAPAGRRPRVEAQFMVWRENFRHMPEMAALGRQLGVDSVILKGVKLLQPELRLDPADFPEARAIISRLVEEDCTSGRYLLNFDLSSEPELNQHAYAELKRWPARPWPDAPDFIPRAPRIHYCYMGWVSSLVSASGLVYPCCPLYGVPGKELGNVFEQPFAEIWTGPRYQHFRREVQRHRLLGGQMEYSQRMQKTLEPVCLQEFGCLFGYHLCSHEFYDAAAQRLEGEAPRWRRLAARAGDAAIRQVHRVTSRLRRR